MGGAAPIDSSGAGCRFWSFVVDGEAPIDSSGAECDFWRVVGFVEASWGLWMGEEAPDMEQSALSGAPW